MTDDLGNLGIDLAELGIPAGSAVAATIGLNWLAGPSLKAVGKAFGEWTDLRVRNLLRLGEKIEVRSRDASQDELDADGVVPPRLLYRVLEDGSWIDDDVAQEYLAGILIDSRTASDNEDGVFLARVVSDLTATQIRVHFALYAALARHAPNIEIGMSEVANSHAVWTGVGDFESVLGKERASESALIFACLALERSGLANVVAIGDPFNLQVTEFFDRRPNQPVLVVVPTVLGAELYKRVHAGQSRDNATELGPTLANAWVSPSHLVPDAL